MAWDWEKLNEQQKGKKVGITFDFFFDLMKKIKLPGGPTVLLVLLVIILGGYSTFFTIESGSVGVIQRLGKYVRIAHPGLNLRIPFGIETIKIVKQDRVHKEGFGVSSDSDSMSRQSRSDALQTSSVSLMLTGDLNVAVVPWVIQYRISNSCNYLFNIKEPISFLRDMSESSMRLVVGDRGINEVISKRKEIADEAKEVLQKELDRVEAGIWIVALEMNKTNVPIPVQPSFNEVNEATQEKERLIYEAQKSYNKAVPAARGDAERIIKASEGYALERVNKAKGEAARFKAQYNEFIKAKDITKKRMYLENMEALLPKIEKKVIIDSEHKNVLPLLNFNIKSNGG